MIEQLSSGNPAVRKITAIVVIVSALFFDLALLLRHLRESNDDWSLMIELIVIPAAISLYLYWSSTRLKIVSMDDRNLYIEDQKNSISVPLDQMQEAHFIGGSRRTRGNSGTATILLKSNTIFGREIMFIPRRGRRTVQELIDVIVSIQDRQLFHKARNHHR